MRTQEKWIGVIRNRFLNTLTPRLAKDIEQLPAFNMHPDTEINSIFLWGDVGTGKTVYAAQLLVEEARRIYLTPDNRRTYTDCLFVSVPELFRQLKASFDDNAKFNGYMSAYMGCHILVLDDIGAEKSSEWALQQLYLILNHRYEYMKKTIITSNKPLEDLAEFFGDDRITSRIRRMGEIAEKRKRW